MLNGLTYVNIHTGINPLGESRGQICDMASSSTRNAGTNPNSYTASSPVLGSTFTGTVDLTTTGHAFALLIGFDSPFLLTLGGGQTVLCLDLAGSGELLGLPLTAGPMASFSTTIPNDLSLCGIGVCTQAVHIGGVVPFRLSNAVDLILGL
jgi:hypothetical protein